MRLPRIFRTLALAAVALAFPHAVAAQQTPCSSEAYRVFDFWTGTWEVQARGGIAGHNTIAATLNGCVLHEHYTTPAGYEGQSFTMYDAGRDVWHQTWVDNTGTLLRIEGQYVDGAMVLEGETVDAQGNTVLNRISWNRIDGNADRVRQHWEISSDGGQSWQSAFDGTYVRMGAGAGG